MYNSGLKLQWQLVPSSNEHWQPPVNPYTGLPTQWPLNPANYMLSGWPAPGQGFYGGPSMSGPSGGFYGGPSYHGGPPATSLYSGQPGTSFYGGPSSYSTPPGPVYQGMAPNHWQHPPNQYQPPNPGPKRNRRKKWARKAAHPYPNQTKHESSGAVFYDRSTGVYRTHSSIDANNKPRIGKPLPAYREPEGYYVENLKEESTMAAGSQIPTPAGAPSTSTSHPIQATSTMFAAPTSSWTPYAETSKKTSVQKSTKPAQVEDEDDDDDAISLGSED